MQYAYLLVLSLPSPQQSLPLAVTEGFSHPTPSPGIGAPAALHRALGRRDRRLHQVRLGPVLWPRNMAFPSGLGWGNM